MRLIHKKVNSLARWFASYVIVTLALGDLPVNLSLVKPPKKFHHTVAVTCSSASDIYLSRFIRWVMTYFDEVVFLNIGFSIPLC